MWSRNERSYMEGNEDHEGEEEVVLVKKKKMMMMMNESKRELREKGVLYGLRVMNDIFCEEDVC